MRAGPLRHRCALQEAVRVKNRTGGFDVTWTEIGKPWAEITLPTGRIAPVAEQLSALVTVEIRIRPRADAVAGNRMVHTEKGMTSTYLIEAALLNNERDMLRLLCSNVPNP
ncbi:head-tail adaptor protein [Pseudomonas vancouverensis]|uniref:Head-tail adaptor protein n=1 Tax=Pseudomonas vancouverensis TaxID=95300 RepID=A0A1H2MX43_PSEVA|nr:head-tail adaptor protein [Pseudomonas vancouverensis]KAB0489643.1 head-tail adaptor protein [Pseudomonas vancouverensis]TDB69289.1 head-tail adaptor protein [Pseudomonas vancouverensis]SDU97475.1 Phage head-tail joining protein [Pseudomonas vancouverensis]